MSDFDVNACTVPCSALPGKVPPWSEDSAPGQPSSEDAALAHQPEVPQAGLGSFTLPALAGTVSLGALDGGSAWGRVATAAEGLGTRLVTGVSVGVAAVGAFVLVLAVPARAGDPPESLPPPAPSGAPGGGRSPDPDLPELGPAVGGLLLQRALSERNRGEQSEPEVPRDFESAGAPGRTQVGLPDVNGVVPPWPGFLPPAGQPPAGFLVLPPASHPDLADDGRPRASAGKPPEDETKASSADGTTNAADAGDGPGPAADTDPAHRSLQRELGVSIEAEYVGGTRRSVLASLPPEGLADVAAWLSDSRLKGVPPEQMPEVLAALRAGSPLVQLLRRGESSGKPMLAHVPPFLEAEPVTVQAVAARLLHAMQAAGLGDGDLLPTYPELAQQFGVLPHWVQQGMAYLQGRGLVDAQQSRRGGLELVGAPAAAARLPVPREVFDRLLAALGNPLSQPEHRSARAWAAYVRELGVSLGEDGRAPLGEALLAGTRDVQWAHRQLGEMLLDLDKALAALAPHAEQLHAKGLVQAASLERGQVADLQQLRQRVGELRNALAPQPEPAPPSPAAVAEAREAVLSWLTTSGVDARTADRLARGGDPTIAGTPLASPLQWLEHRGANALIGFLRALGVDAADPLTHPDRVRAALLGTGTAAWRIAEIDRLQTEIAGTLPALQAHTQALGDAGLPLAAARARRDVEFLAGLSSKLAWLRDTSAR